MKIKGDAKVPEPPDGYGVGLTKEHMTALGTVARAAIVRRLLEGLGIDDKAMRYQGKVYSDAYKGRRDKSGRQVDKRDLHWSGTLYRSIHVRDATSRSFVLGIGGERRLIAKAQHEMTPWWPLSPKDEQKLLKALDRFLQRKYSRR